MSFFVTLGNEMSTEIILTVLLNFVSKPGAIFSKYFSNELLTLLLNYEHTCE